MEDEKVSIKILGPPEKRMGATYTKERRKPLKVDLVAITPKNVNQYLPDYQEKHQNRFEDDMERLKDGRSYWCVAIHPRTKQKVGVVMVNCEENNCLSMETEEEFQRRGVAKQLVKHLQEKFESLSLVNHAGQPGKEFYAKMGFVLVDEFEYMTWEKDSH